MNTTAALGGAAAFLAGAAAALLASYPISENSLYVCFIALFLALGACIAAGTAVALFATHRERLNLEEAVHRERVRVERIAESVVERLLVKRGLELVDRE